MDNLFSTDKYSSLYDLTYDKFIDCLVKTIDEGSLNKYNQAISSFIIDSGGDIGDISGVQNWMGKLILDTNIYSLQRSVIDIRIDTHKIFYNKIDSLSGSGYLHKDVSKDERISEAVFLVNSISFYAHIMQKKLESSNVDPSKKDKKEVNHLGNIVGLLVAGLIIGIVHSALTIDRIDSASTFVGLTFGYGLTSMLIGVVSGFVFAGIYSLVKKRPLVKVMYKVIWITFLTMTFLAILGSL